MLILSLGVFFSILFPLALLVRLDAPGTILVTFSLSLDILVWIIFGFFLYHLVGLSYFWCVWSFLAYFLSLVCLKP